MISIALIISDSQRFFFIIYRTDLSTVNREYRYFLLKLS